MNFARAAVRPIRPSRRFYLNVRSSDENDVAKLNRLFNQPSLRKNARLSGFDLTKAIRRKWKHPYDCNIFVDDDGFLVLAVTSKVCDHLSADYMNNMDEVAKELNRWKRSDEVLSLIQNHINNEGPTFGGWMFGGRGRILIKTSIVVDGNRQVEWDL